MTTAIFSVQGSTHKAPMIYQTSTDHLIGFKDGRLSFRRLPESVTEFTKAFTELELVDTLYHLKLAANRYNKSIYDRSIEELTILCEEIHAAKNSGERVLASSVAKSICKPLLPNEMVQTSSLTEKLQEIMQLQLKFHEKKQSQLEREKQLAQAAAYNKNAFEEEAIVNAMKEAEKNIITALNRIEKKND